MKGKIDKVKAKIESMKAKDIRNDNGNYTTVGVVAKEHAKAMISRPIDKPAYALVITTLAMHQRWVQTANPRFEAFKRDHPKIETLDDLKKLIDSMSEVRFCVDVLKLRAKKKYWRYNMLRELVKAFIQYRDKGHFRSDKEAMAHWAKTVDISNLDNDPIGRIKHVGLATIQNIRITLGIDTVKPDIHVKNALRELGLDNEVGVVGLLSELTGYKNIELDQIFWWHDTRTGNT